MTEDDIILDMIGVPGQSVMEESDSDSSVMALTRIADEESQEIVLPLEKRYIVDKAGRRYVPGDDYFFDGLTGNENKFDISRLSKYERRFQRHVLRSMDVIEAALLHISLFSNAND